MDALLDLPAPPRLRDELRPFLERNNALAITVVLIDFAAWIATTCLAVVVDPIWLKVVLAVTSGALIGTLFVLGHDAAHGALTSRRLLNAILARLVFLPALHNVSLWSIQHNRLHHRFPNVKGINSWSPYTLEEFRRFPLWKRTLERVYRCGLGIPLYYLVERWGKHKFMPGRSVEAQLRGRAWADFGLLLVWLVAWLSTVVWIGERFGHSDPPNSLLWGFLIPFIVWNQLMGLTVLLQHTHPTMRWYRTPEEARKSGGQEMRTVHVRYPRWYGFLTHDIMEHPAHHLNPTIPFYHLNAAQMHLNEVLGPDAFVEDIRPTFLLHVIRQCKLYDYDRHVWIDFSGRDTSRAYETMTHDSEAPLLHL